MRPSSPRRPRSGSDSAAPECWFPADGSHGGCGAAKRLRGFGGRRHVRLSGGGQAGERCPGRGRGPQPARGRGGAAAELAFPLAGLHSGLAPGEGEGGLAVLVTPARRLGWLLPLIPRGSCGVEPRCREAVAIPSLRGEAWAAQRQATSLKRSFLRLDCALAARMWHLG